MKIPIDGRSRKQWDGLNSHVQQLMMDVKRGRNKVENCRKSALSKSPWRLSCSAHIPFYIRPV